MKVFFKKNGKHKKTRKNSQKKEKKHEKTNQKPDVVRKRKEESMEVKQYERNQKRENETDEGNNSVRFLKYQQPLKYMLTV